MKAFKIYYETENGVETTMVLAKSRRSLELPVKAETVIKIKDITDNFKEKLKCDLETIVEKTNDEIIVSDIISVLKAVELF